LDSEVFLIYEFAIYEVEGGMFDGLERQALAEHFI
jgi:hypothetical protein